jgi:DNA-binding response OmpR family regulator
MGPSLKGSYRDARLDVNFERRTASLDGRAVDLTRKEFELLSVLVAHSGRVVPREELLREIWGYSSEIRTRTLDVHIRRIRKKLSLPGDGAIETIFGVGYRFQPFRSALHAACPPILAISA